MSLRVTGLLLILIMLSACGPEITFQEERELGSAGWAYADSVAFTFPVTDTAARYDLVLSVTHGQDFPFQNFYTHLATHLPDGQVLTQPLSLQLANTFGEWHGDCSGDRCTADISLQEGTRFTQTGEHRLVVAQFSRRDPLPGVSKVGFRIVKREE